MGKEKPVHYKHRERLRTKIKNNGLKSLPNHEVLEYLLTHTLPRKDTNPIAHNLINTFGGLSNVFRADLQDLQLVQGVGKESALFLKSLGEFLDIIKECENKNKAYKLSNTQTCVQYFRENFVVTETEEFYLTCTRKNYSIIKTVKLLGEDSTTVNIDTREITHIITSKDVHHIVIFHTHPNGEIKPSKEDELATIRIREICKTIGIKIVDHIIFNETGHYSFKQENEKLILTI